jgi:hypothetical protein
MIMGECYEIFIFDELNWNYKDFNREKVIAQIKEVCSNAELTGSGYGMLIFDIGKKWPGDFVGKVTMDSMKVRGDYNLLVIEDYYINKPTKINSLISRLCEIDDGRFEQIVHALRIGEECGQCGYFNLSIKDQRMRFRCHVAGACIAATLNTAVINYINKEFGWIKT